MIKFDSKINSAREILAESWPLNSFIATNPLWQLRHKPFFEVVGHPSFNGLMNINYYYSQYQAQQISKQSLRYAIEKMEQKSINDSELEQWIAESIEQHFISTPNVLLAEQWDEYQFQNPLTWIKEQIFILLRDYFGLALYKRTDLISFWYEQNKISNIDLENLRSMPIEKSIEFIITKLNIPENLISEYLERIYLQVYGWSSFMNWRNNHPNNAWVPGHDPCEVILLMWLSYEYSMSIDKKAIYKGSFSNLSSIDQNECSKKLYIWQTAFELTYFNQLDKLLNSKFTKKICDYEAQFIFCIDTRSEGLRRHIEAQGNYETFGFAGFFGAIFKLNDDGNISYQAPALVEPSVTLNTVHKDSKLNIFMKKIKGIISYTKKQLASPFALFEILGFWFAFYMIFKALQPKLKIKHKTHNLKIKNTLSEDAQFQAVYNLLTSIGLVDHFSRWIFVCAHQSDNINNPFKSSLNCGACGGNSGIANAIVICQSLNNQTIRLKLKEAGIDIPTQTQFIPACHHTSYDRLEVLEGEIKESIQQAIDRAAKNLRAEKVKTLPGNNKLSNREQNWSELIPELGLVNNTAIIIGPRDLTLNKHLERRTFLHSYAPHLDKDGDILTSILSAPAIVAHWISAQYYFSTVNPEHFGAGNKAIHNVVPSIGVLEGNLSDLRIGLPLQSTQFQSMQIHEPRRIIVVVYAHKKTLDTAIKNAPEFKMLLDNQWIYLKHIEV